MNYAFLIRNDRCIGCHACTTACKSENDVPVGVNRTWVKNVDKGRYPDVRRHFQVTRCNHCANPPCVRICPVTAMYQRADGIVEFDPDRCIGCKACLQACPYDAIYIDPDTGTAAKCHFCAHRTDLGLEPACVVVCPEHAIVAGDLDDPDTEISRMLAAFDTTVRKPEQGTAPKLFYVDGDESALVPAATAGRRESLAWAEGPARGPDPGGGASGPGAGRVRTPASGGSARAPSGTPIRRPGPQGTPSAAPIRVEGGSMAGTLVRPFYDVHHRVPWHWPVPAYLVTKGIAAGLFLLLALGTLLGPLGFRPGPFLAVGLLTLAFTGATTGLLVWDLERPERFLRVLTRPQWGSWLTRGAWILVGFTAVVGGWWLAELAAWRGWIGAAPVEALRPWLLAAGALLGGGTAVYTGFLFGQAEGRDLWQSPLLPVHLLVQAGLAGAGLLVALEPLLPALPGAVGAWEAAGLGGLARTVLVTTLVADLAVLLLGELGMPHASADAARAAHEIVRGRFAVRFWAGVVVAGHLVPLALLLVPVPGDALAGAAAGLLALAGLHLFEDAFVTAPQEIPNS